MLSIFNIPGVVPHAELQKQQKLNSCPQGVLSSRQNRHENRALLTEERATAVRTQRGKGWPRAGESFSVEVHELITEKTLAPLR